MKNLSQKKDVVNTYQNIGIKFISLKFLILLTLLTFFSTGFKAKAQTFTVDVTNTAPLFCDWMVIVYDNSSSVIASFTSLGGSGLVTFGCYSGVPDHLIMTYTGGGCQSYLFGSGGTFSYAWVNPSCAPPATSCSSFIDCAGGASSANCFASPPVGDYVILIQIQ